MATPTLKKTSDSTPEIGDYWAESRRPLTSLVFTAPLLVIYEAGILWLGPDAIRNAAEAWLRFGLEKLGFRAYFLLPLLTVGILVGWHYVTRQPWRVDKNVLYGMMGECLGLSLCLWLVWYIQKLVTQSIAGALRLSIGGVLGSISGYLGAGLYEELLFRLILLTLAIGLLMWLRAGRMASTIVAVVATSLMFSAAHYGPYGDTFAWFSFCFRFLAGVFFSILFLKRGFGIAAGTHAVYDVLIGMSTSA